MEGKEEGEEGQPAKNDADDEAADGDGEEDEEEEE